MKAQRILRWGGPLSYTDVPEPAVQKAEALLRVEACGVGLTVLNCMRGDLGNDPADLPRIPGHEIVGTVAAVGDGVSEEWIGRVVCVHFYLFCGACPRCTAGNETLCQNLDGYVAVNRDGGYAEYCTVPMRNIIPLPRPIDPVLATAIPDAIATPLHVAHRAGIKPGEHVVVVAGGGGVGVHMVQVAQVYGAEVVALDVVDAKLAFLETQFGAGTANSSDFETVRLPTAWQGRADVVVDLLGTKDSLSWGFSVLDAGGRLVLLTTFPGIDFPVSPRDAVFLQRTVLGSRYASRWEIDLAAHLVASGRIRPIVTRTLGLREVETIHRELNEGTLLGRGAVNLRSGKDSSGHHD